MMPITSTLRIARTQKTPALSRGSNVRFGPNGIARNAANTGANAR
jgi:hypothetical protein